jgi:exodeoxyribonuclease V alpha subunit
VALSGQEFALARRGFNEADNASLERLFRHVERFRLLCLTNSGRLGVDAVNRRLHEWVLDADRAHRRLDFHPGEPILMLENDYDRMIFNGDQGLVLLVREDGDRPHPMAVFRREGGFQAFPLDSLRGRLKLAFAMTVHKSQGSEFEHIALLLPPDDLPINTREILYTAVTRSKKSVAIVGRREVLLAGVRKRIHRYSGIAEKLAALAIKS